MALSQLTSCYPLITTPHLAESRDFFVRHFGFEVGFEASWFVWLSRRTSESGTVALAFMSPDHPSRPPGPDTAHGAWVIEIAGPRRFLVAFDELDGRSSLCRDFDGKRKPVWSRAAKSWLETKEGHHGGSDDYRVALRDGRPAVIWIKSARRAPRNPPDCG